MSFIFSSLIESLLPLECENSHCFLELDRLADITKIEGRERTNLVQKIQYLQF